MSALPSTVPPSLDPLILNAALDLALEWGEYWLQPTQPRLAKLHAQLSEEQLNAYDATARAAMSLAFDMLYASPDAGGDALRRHVHAEHSWVNASNMSRLHTQGVYYAHK